MASIALEEYELLGDPKYRSYVSAIDKALKSFEYTSEWADLISALGKLNKVLLNNTKYPIIPRRITISKRLAQCMHPALPSGVHLKALETYDIIFKSVGISRLSSELFIYSAGLFPLLSHAAMNVKPALLTVYENHFVPLRERLRPGLNGFLIGVLPGLEEGTEYYERTDLLLQKVCDGVGKSYFYGSLWQCILSNPSIRLPAISYIISHFNKKLSMEDQLYIIGTDIDIMVQGISAALQDSSVLVQRTALDLLLLGFPMHNCQLVRDDMVRIVTAAITVVLRRDMSLNRRLFAWLLGVEASSVTKQLTEQCVIERSDSVASCDSEGSMNYFDLYSKDLLLEALQLCLGDPSHIGNFTTLGTFRELWCYRLLISLFDRPEISSTILDDILLEVFRSLYLECMEKKYVPCLGTYHRPKDNKANSELIKTANLLFGTLDPSYLWNYCAHLLNKACSEAKNKRDGRIQKDEDKCDNGGVQRVGSGIATILEVCMLTNFLLDIVSLETYIETPTEHLPLLLRNIISALSSCCDVLTANEIEAYLKLSSKILSKAQPTVILNTPESLSSPKSRTAKTESLKQEESKSVKDSSTTCHQSGGQIASSNGSHNQSNTSVIDLRLKIDKSSSEPPKNSWTSSLITLCVSSFQDFFVKLINCRLLRNPQQAKTCYRSLLVSYKEKLKQRDSELEALLYKCLYSSKDKVVKLESYTQSDKAKPANDEKLQVDLTNDSQRLASVFRQSCVILNELSSFPVYCTTAKCQLDTIQAHSDCTELPEWLQLLLVFSCFVKQDEFHFAAIRAVLDLIALTKSVAVKQDIPESAPSSAGLSPTPLSVPQAGVYSVVIIPTVTNSELKFLWEETNFFERSAGKLWNYLDSTLSMHHIHTVELLQNLQNLAQDGSACESIICKSMTSESETEQIEARKKFCILWHLTRDVRLKSTPSKMTRAFDRPLFLMLESLGTETGPQKSIAQTWLNHCLQRGDIARILEPLLLILLHPDTARISIQHVVIQHPRKVKIGEENDSQESAAEAKIYAISSMGGNIIYHISSEDKFLTRCSSPKKKILALTSIIQTDNNGEAKVITSNSMLQDFELPSIHERDVHLPIKMIVNPFGSLTSLVSDPLESSSPPDLSNIKRLDMSSLLGKYSSFDADDEYEVLESTVEKEETTLDIVSSILDEVITSVISDKTTSSSDKDYPLSEMFHETENPHHRDSESLYSDEQQSHSLSASSDANQQQQRLGIYQLHNHILLYSQVYDSSKTTYALSALKAVILTNPRVALGNMATTSINSSLSPRGQELQILLARHRKSLSGKNFHGDLSAEAVTAYRSHMFVDVIVSACLYYLRGYYPNLPQVRLTEEEIVGNQNVRLLCTEVLTLVFSELVGIVKESGKSFASYLSDLLSRCRVQRALLQCLVACVYNPILEKDNRSDSEFMFTKAVMDFNENSPWPDEDKACPSSDFQDTFQIHLLRLIATLIILEDCVVTQNNSKDSRTSSLSSKPNKPGVDGPSKPSYQQPMSAYKYHQGVPIPCQPMFLSCVSGALRQHNKAHLHTHWLALIMSALPFSGRSLTALVIQVVSQLCRNLEMVAVWCSRGNDSVLHSEKPPEEEMEVPPDFLLTMVEGLTTLCHYCLLDIPASVASPLSQPPLPPIPYQPYAPGASQILYNLLHVFSTTDAEKDPSTTNDSSSHVDPLMSTRRALLSHLPRILAALVATWQAISSTEKSEDDQPKPWWIIGTPKAVKQHILSFLSPISLHHGSSFMTAVAVVWYECRQKNPLPTKKIMPIWSSEQQLLVELVGAIKVLPMEMVVQTVRQVIRQPPPIAHIKKKKVPVEVSILQFFLAYVQSMQGTQLVESWQSLLGLWKDGLQLSSSPPVQFHLLAILHEFVQRAPLLEDKKDQKDLQDIAQKLIETCSTIAGASLEQTRWLRRNLAVRPGPQHEVSDSDLDVEDSSTQGDKSSSAKGTDSASATSSGSNNTTSSNIPYSVQALSILAEFLAPVLDVVYVSEEKEKVVPLLTSIMYYVTPYLRNHSKHNAPSFRACSQLLSSISGYQYTRKAWKRDTFDLLLDPAFFQMDDSCVSYWRAIIDHLMTHDKTTFRDFLTRVSLTQSGSLNLFSSKEQEYEQRAQLLKRLAFVLFCSEVDQYQKYMPEIQERLSESLRLHQVPSVQAQVFLCFRVVLLRMSPHHVTSLWPLIITEMVQIFLQMEHELSTDSEEFRRASSSHLRRLSMLESSWVISGSNGLAAHNHPAWLQLYLSACKLLDLTVALPADMLPQFQMYRWAFVGDGPPPSSENNNVTSNATPDFVPHISRLASLLNKNDNYRSSHTESIQFVPGRPLLNMPSIKSMQQLQPFFNSLANISHQPQTPNGEVFRGKSETHSLAAENKGDLFKSHSAPELSRCPPIAKEFSGLKSFLSYIEHILEADFLEPLPSS